MEIKGQVKGRRHPVASETWLVTREGCDHTVCKCRRQGDAIAESMRLSRKYGGCFNVEEEA